MSVTHLVRRAARPVVIVIFIQTLHLLSKAQHLEDNSITCDIPAVEPLANTSVTCHFPLNVSHSQRIVVVSFYEGRISREESNILDCYWLWGNMDCDISSGHTFNRMISNELTLEIPRVSTKDIGRYACKLSNMNPKDIKPCELKIKLVGKTMCDVPPVPLSSRASLTCYFPEDLSKTRANFRVHHGANCSDPACAVVTCEWGDNLVCSIQRGYHFDLTVTSHLIVGIPTAQEEQEGSYSCYFTSSTPVRYEHCSLTLVTVTSSCNISRVTETEPASLTCTFNVDVNETRNNFSLVRFGGGDSKGVDIVTCTWLKDQLKCTTATGYEVNNLVTDHLVIRVPRASRDHTGTYACHVNGSKASGFQSCEFILKPVTSFCNISSIKETEPASLTCTFNVDVNATKSNLSLVRLGGDESKGVDIVTCTWLKDQLKCTTAPGYEVNNLVTDRLVIRVPRASRDHTGTYACHVTDSKASGFQRCEFILKPVTSFCNISSIKETKPASLTCTFNVDVNATKSNLSLVRLGGDESKGVDIVTCTWLQDQLKCTTAPGYEVNNLVTDRLVIRVPRASRDHTGTYACHVTGSSVDGFKSCDFILIPDVPAVVLTVAIAVLVFIPVSLVIIFLVFKCKPRKEATKRVSSEETSLISPDEKKLESEEEFWEKWVEAAFPNLDTDVYFLPPVPVNVQSSGQADESSQAATAPGQDSDDQDDAAMQRFLVCLEKMCKSNREVLVGVSGLLFDDYRRKSCDGDSAGEPPRPPKKYFDLRQKWKKRDIDVLLIHRQFGLVICKIFTFDNNVNEHSTSREEMTKDSFTEIKIKLEEAISQLDSAGFMVEHLVSGIAYRLRVIKTIVFHNLTTNQLDQVLQGDSDLERRLCECLEAREFFYLKGLCLCCDQLSDPKTPYDVSSHVLRELGHWWQRLVTEYGLDPHMTREVYKTLVASVSPANRNSVVSLVPRSPVPGRGTCQPFAINKSSGRHHASFKCLFICLNGNFYSFWL
ncbi:uncharacterized protein LOC112574793 isoform X1 [Pomacea canaliculata]|uniref:uncharacterized protein LOC112574793 isoform X1 n=1 Tax=Pomacea canaliculata TaxID=400727 RepID=UPI000D73C54E|nr:uncharacterized protein LOC112574793 isoform X1 [Pomacea canaliculata]